MMNWIIPDWQFRDFTRGWNL